jgi:hypothetical protein
VANLPNFNFTKQADVFSIDEVLPGTAVNVRKGNKLDGSFLEGNGIVTAVNPLEIHVYLFDLQLQSFVETKIQLAEFVNDAVSLSVLTLEDGVGSERTGALPSDLVPPANVTDLNIETTDTTATLTYVLPMDEDFDHLEIYQDGVLVGPSVTAATFNVTGLEPLTNYDFTVKSVDTSENVSEGISTMTSTKDVPDTNPPAEVFGLAATDLTAEGATLTYALPGDADFSHVQIFEGDVLVADNVVESNYVITGLVAGDYTYTVKTVDETGNVSEGVDVTFTVA